MMKSTVRKIARTALAGLFWVVMLSLIAVSLCGCGHNVLAFSSGKYLNVGVDPNTGKTGIQYINGDQITAVEKDCAKLTVELRDALDSDGKKTTRVSKITYEIGEQTTGSDVDMENAKK